MTTQSLGAKSAVFQFPQQAPWEPGVYRVQFALESDDHFKRLRYSHWSGSYWGKWSINAEDASRMAKFPTSETITHWWGLAAPYETPLLYIQETWSEAKSRIPALAAYSGQSYSESAAAVCALLDTRPGYQLQQVMTPFGAEAVAIFRRVAAA